MEECKDLGKLAKQKEKEIPSEAVELYIQAANCFAAKDNQKDNKTNLEKAAKLLREIAKSIEDPTEALAHYEQSSSIYSDIDKQVEGEKVLQEAHQKFIHSAKMLQSEANKIEDLEIAVGKLKQASDYALKGKNEQLFNECWIDSGDFYLKKASQIQDPRDALKIYEEAVINYRQGNDKKKRLTSLERAAENFSKKANEIYKTQKTLVLALDNYIQAFTLYRSINVKDKAIQNEKKAEEICDMIGIPQDSITNYLETQGIFSISISEKQKLESEKEESHVDLDTKSDQTRIEENERAIVSKESLESDREVLQADQEKPQPEIKEPYPEEISETEIEIVDEKISEPVVETIPIQEEKIEQDREFDTLINKVPEAKLEVPPVIPEISKEITPVAKELVDQDIENPIENQEVSESDVEIPIDTQEISEPTIEIPLDTMKDDKSDFLEDFDFENKEGSSIKNRIKSELRGQSQSPSTDIEEGKKKTADIENLFDDALDESMEEFLSDFDDVIIVEKGGKPVITGPIIEILREQGYIKEDLSKEEELQKVPEYQILLIIIKEHPLPLETIEERSDIDSVSMVISNLQADNLIEQTNDYQWTISEKVKENIREFMSQTLAEGKSKFEEQRSNIIRDSKYEHLLIVTLYKFGVIPELDVSVMELMQIPEFAVIKTIKDNEPAEFNLIAEVVSEIPPVQVTRMLSRLETEERIRQNTNGQWELSNKLAKELVIKRE
ncbi:MAG: hypothetical protein HeimC2_19960 [Candidatus Heimdallarchaeota archaeon LC_2]|nr:MAG: hypothetical protein HeimC2_19960 [Candidatus Heimdallarchaeota archaeon LC_2]